MDTFCTWAILILFLFTVAWGPLALGGRRPSLFLVIQGATVLMLALWMVRFWVQRPFRLLWPPMCWAVLAFLLYAIVRCPLVEVEFNGRQQLVQALVYGAIFFVAINNLNRRDSATVVSLTLISVGFFMALFAVFQFATHYPFVWGERRLEQYMDRGCGTFVNPNHLAGLLGLTVPLALSYTVVSRLSATLKVLLGYSALAMLAGIVVSVSRGGILTAAIALIAFCGVLLVQGNFWRQSLVILCILTLLAVGAATQFESVQKRFHKTVERDDVADERTLYWTGAWELFSRQRVWGIGPGHFDVEFPSVRDWKVQSRPVFVHNDYLNTLCDWGIVGLGCIAAACALLYWGAYRVWQNLRRDVHIGGPRFSDRSAFVIGASVGLLAMMLHCVVEFNMQIPGVAVAVIALMALLAAQWRFATERYWSNPGLVGKILLTGIAAVVIGYLSMQGLRSGKEQYWLDRADMRVDTPERIITYAAKAQEIEPMDWETDEQVAEYLWSLSLEDSPNSLERVKQAEAWYARAAQLNPFDGYAPLGCGMCLDRLDKTQEATTYFEAALRNDPHNCYVSLELGRHCIELGELEAAKRWLLFGACKVAATEVAIAEYQKLERHMNDPLYMASAALNRDEKARDLERNKADPLLQGPR